MRRDALSLEQPDYEDGIVAACLLSEEVDAVITRDKRAFSTLEVSRYEPADVFAVRGRESIDL